MKILITCKELSEKGLWSEYSDLMGFNPYAKSEGLIVETEEFEIDEETMKKLGLKITKED